MKIVFVSNYFNHHQKYLSNALNESCDEFVFVSTAQMREERRKLGYAENIGDDYVYCTYESKEVEDIVFEKIDSADVVIFGMAPEKYLTKRIDSGKLVFRYSERPLKFGIELFKYLPRLLRWHKRNPKGKPIYMLCASAYTASDYKRFGLFKNRSYKWGYFPRVKNYSLDKLIAEKNKNHILWCGRFLDWKHPDDVINVAKRLKTQGYDFTLNLIGTGETESALAEMINAYDLSDRVHLLGSMPPEKVREHMEVAGIYLFTSDRQEGWGAVLNESMNSGCAVIGSHAAGSVPFLIKDGENGLIYRSGDVDMLYEKTKYLLDHPEEQDRLGRAAYKTISGEWNAEVAAERLIMLSEKILSGDMYPKLFKSGPCSGV